MEQEEVQFWTFGCEDGNIMIHFDKNTKYIKVSPKDLRRMMSWMLMQTNRYRPDWDREF